MEHHPLNFTGPVSRDTTYVIQVPMKQLKDGELTHFSGSEESNNLWLHHWRLTDRYQNSESRECVLRQRAVESNKPFNQKTTKSLKFSLKSKEMCICILHRREAPLMCCRFPQVTVAQGTALAASARAYHLPFGSSCLPMSAQHGAALPHRLAPTGEQCWLPAASTLVVVSHARCSSHQTHDHWWPCVRFNCSSCVEQFANGSAVFWVIGHFSTPPKNWTVRAFLQLTPQLSNDFTAAWLTFNFPQLFAVAATLKSIDYNVAMTFILNNNNNNNNNRSASPLASPFIQAFSTTLRDQGYALDYHAICLSTSPAFAGYSFQPKHRGQAQAE